MKKGLFFNLSALIAMMFIVLFVAGCDNGTSGGGGNNQALVGTWVNGGGETYVLNSNGTGIWYDEYDEDDESEFKWKANKNTVTLTFKETISFNFPGGNILNWEGVFTRTSGSGNSIVGTWEANEDEYKYILEFKSNGTVIAKQYENNILDYEETASYTQNGTTVTISSSYTEVFEYNAEEATLTAEWGDIFTKRQ